MILVKLLKPLFLFLMLFLVTYLHATTDDQQIKIALRKIGHEFLLELHDSTSRVLPIEKIDGRYAVRFERPFSFVPDVLNNLTWKYLVDIKKDANYIVEVERCGTKQVVHSFEVSTETKDSAVACAGRALPLDCYVFYYTVIDSTNLNPVEQTKIIDTESNENSASKFYLLLLILPIGLLIYFLLRSKKKNKKLPNTDFIQIGQFQYDPKRMVLHFNSETTELSGKESELLLLLHSNENKTLDKEFILNQVWQDSGEYVGRTLDVFISKLRKKLEADPSLKIINIRGVGYKFVVG